MSATARDALMDDGRPFVGREREFDELRAGVQAAASGHGGLFLVAGEAGIGKTRLADAVAAHARVHGSLPLRGRCWEGPGAPPYWPWVQMIRDYARGCDPSSLGQQMGRGALYLGRLVPELADRLEGERSVAEPASLDSEDARFHLYDATTTFLRNAAAERPLVLLMEDLHAADRPSLLMLQFLAGELPATRVLVVGSYRDPEVRRLPELATTLGRIARHGRSISLLGLEEAAVARLIEGSVGIRPSPALVTSVRQAAGGNPLFVNEVVRMLVAEGRLQRPGPVVGRGLGIPDGVREAVRARVAPLSPDCCATLATAAVIGLEFEVAVLLHASDVRPARLLEALGEARAAGVVHPVPGTAGRYRFAHALTRETLYDDLPAGERVACHRRVGVALEELFRADPGPHLAEIAAHFCEGSPGDDAEKAIEYCTRAARRALELRVYEEAATHYERALRAVALRGAGEERRCELLLELGTVQDRAGGAVRANETFQQAAEIARRLARTDLLARAALGPGGAWAATFTSTIMDRSDPALLEEALGAIGSTDGPLRAELLARLALHVRYAGSAERAAALSHEAVAMARRLDAPAVLGLVLCARHGVLLGPDHRELRLGVASEILRIGERIGSRPLVLRGHALRVYDLGDLGDMAAYDRELDAYRRLAGELGEPFDVWMVGLSGATRALMSGRLADAERLTEEALAAALRVPGVQAADENCGFCFAGQTVVRRDEQQISGQMEPAAVDILASHPTVPVLRCMAIKLYVAPEAARRREIDELAAGDFAAIPRDSVWLGSLSLIAEACHDLGERRHAERLYDLLLPYAGHVANLASVVNRGAVSRYLGLLATTLGRWEQAAAHYEAALAANAAMGASLWVTHTEHDYAAMLFARGAAPAAGRARALVRRARRRAVALGMTRLAWRLRELARVRVDAPPKRPARRAGMPRRRAGENVFRREGEYWTIVYDDAVLRLRDTKGLACIACLLRHPGRELHAAELLALAGGGAAPHPTGAPAELSVHPVFDPPARAAYRRRISELREEVDEARGRHEAERAERAQAELDCLAAEVARGLGLGGRVRRMGSAGERARLNVTRAIKRALGHIARNHPSLGAHLMRTVHTGTFCSYVPDPRLPPAWRT
jgi:AAA ATPase domain